MGYRSNLRDKYFNKLNNKLSDFEFLNTQVLFWSLLTVNSVWADGKFQHEI